VKQPTILVQPEGVTFTINGNGGMHFVPVRIYNCGDKDLVLGSISGMQTSGPSQGLSIGSTPANGTTIAPQTCSPSLPPMEGAMFQIEFNSADYGLFMGTATVPSNDPIRPSVNVQITAQHNM